MKKKFQNEAVIVSAIYAAFGILWILLSDSLLSFIFQDLKMYKQLQTYKGWFYILITTLLLYLLIRHRVYLLRVENLKTELAYDEVKRLAYYDKLTGLPNRTLLESEISRQILQDSSEQFSLAYIDIDNFKNINDNLGHQIGDRFLIYFSDCLRAEVKDTDFVARLGGDEFVIFYRQISKEELLDRIEAMKMRVSKTWSIENKQFFISMSIGVVNYPNDGESSKILLKNVDIAMNTAKREGKNRVLFYEEEIRETNEKHLAMINNLQYGIEENQFLLYYQPQFCLASGAITGMEALVRWIHPEEGFIPPGQFIPLAEESGQIYKLERWIVASALEQKKRWENEGFHDLVMSINLSGKTLTSNINFNEIESIIANSGADLRKVVIEVTETASISNVDIVIRHLNRLKKLGIRIAMDDFGTGYSSLNYLKKFPINIIKLDRSFIDAINENGIDMLLIKNILSLAHDLEFEVVAEGIETSEQLRFLRQHNCESGQGYLFSKPLPVEKMDSILKNGYCFLD